MKKLLLAGAMLLISFSSLMAQAPTTKPKQGGQGQGHPQGQGQGGKGTAQGQHQNWTPEQKADTVAKRMTKQLNLTPDQTTQVRAITLTRAQQMDAIKKQQANNPQEKSKQAHAAREKWEQDLHGILTPDQWAKYQTKKQEHIDKAKQKRAQNPDLNKGKTPEQIQDEVETEAEEDLK